MHEVKRGSWIAPPPKRDTGKISPDNSCFFCVFFRKSSLLLFGPSTQREEPTAGWIQTIPGSVIATNCACMVATIGTGKIPPVEGSGFLPPHPRHHKQRLNTWDSK